MMPYDDLIMTMISSSMIKNCMMIPIKYSNIQKVTRTELGHSVYEILFQFKVNNNLYDYVELISNLVFVHYTA